MLKHLLKTVVLAGGLMFAAASLANTIDQIFRNPGDPVVGNPKGAVTVVEFFDYQCSHCITMSHVMNEIQKRNPNLRIVYKEFPIRGQLSQLAATAALAANKQGKYSAFSHALFDSKAPLTKANIYKIAANTGLNVAQLKKDMKSKAVINQISNTYALARVIHLSGTPAFFIGLTDVKKDSGVSFILGEMSRQELQTAIDKAAQQK